MKPHWSWYLFPSFQIKTRNNKLVRSKVIAYHLDKIYWHSNYFISILQNEVNRTGIPLYVKKWRSTTTENEDTSHHQQSAIIKIEECTCVNILSSQDVYLNSVHRKKTKLWYKDLREQIRSKGARQSKISY